MENRVIVKGMKGEFFYDFCASIVNAHTKEERDYWINFYPFPETKKRIFETLKEFYWNSINEPLQYEVPLHANIHYVSLLE